MEEKSHLCLLGDKGYVEEGYRTGECGGRVIGGILCCRDIES